VPAAGLRPADHVEAWLIDNADPGRNPHLDLVLTQAADTVATLRAEGRTVLIHCVEAKSRTPGVAALYAARHLGLPVRQALADVRAVLPDAQPNAAFLGALDRLDPPRLLRLRYSGGYGQLPEGSRRTAPTASLEDHGLLQGIGLFDCCGRLCPGDRRHHA
jgi:hypothetical protein